MRCTPVMNATRSFVPTPSALATSTGSSMPGRAETEQAAERSDVGQHAGRERAARQRADAADDLVAGVDVDARPACSPCRTSSGAESSAALAILAARACRRPSGRRAARRLPVGATRRRRSAPRRSPLRACRTPRAAARSPGSRIASLSSTLSISGVLRSATVPSASAIGARAGSRVGAPCSIELGRARRVAGDRQRAEAPTRTRAAAPGTRGSRSRSAAIRRGSGWCDAQLTPSRQMAAAIAGCDFARRGALQRRPASRATTCRRSSRAPAPHRPAAARRSWPLR